MYGDVYELRVALLHVEPTVWRGLSVPADTRLDVLHDVLQAAFGWKNCHLHDFRAGDIRFGMADAQEDLFLVDERAVPLGAVARLGSTLVYLYDFGDDWEHEIVVERVVHRGDASIRCTGGERACPPEDCGGPPGYGRMLEALAGAKGEEHEEMRQWAPRRFDAEKFDMVAVNKTLATLAKRVGRWRKRDATPR
jgi:hypothetical protein